MTNGYLILGLGTVLAVGEVGFGLYVIRNADRLVGTSGKPPEPLRSFGRIQMAAAPVILLISAALAFGLFGTSTINPIAF
jgi:hypothetical protein